MGGMNILIDPNWALWLSFIKRVRKPGVRWDSLPPIDLVLVTHAHHDHLHIRSLQEVADGQPIVLPKGVGQLVRSCRFGDVHEVACWDRLRFGAIELVFTPAKHWGARFVHDTHRGFGGFLLRCEGRSVFHCGDSAYFDGFREIGEQGAIDVALMPIGAYSAPSGREVHMTPEEALRAFRELGAKKMVPMHYGTFPLGVEPLDEPLERLRSEAAVLGVESAIDILEEGCPSAF